MNFLRIAKEDIKGILKNRFIRVSIVAIIIVPLLYSLLYLYAFWDPYSRLEDIHVAVVNNDKGTVMDDESVNYGKDIEDELRNNKEIGWTITTEEDANSGLEGKGYYAKVVIPEDFSSKVTSAKEGKPERAKVQFVTNDKKNFLAAQINSKVESELKAKITNNISSNYIEVAFDGLYEAKDGLTQAADGSKQLNDGLSTLNEKVPELADGANKLSDGSSQLLNGQVALNNGINEVSNGSQALNAGLSQLYGKVPTLSNGVAALSNGISTANSGSKQIADGSKALYNAYTSTIYPSVGQLKNGANELNNALNAGGEDIAKLSAGATEIAKNSDIISAGYGQVSDGINKLVEGVSSSSNANAMVTELLTKAASETDVDKKNNLINQALQITQKINEGSKANAPLVQSLVEGNNNLKVGINGYTAGSKALANGTTSLISKVGLVQQGVGKLNSGLNQLNVGLDPSTSEFGVGLKTIADSTANLNKGLNTINTGANDLNSNIPALSTGITDLYNGSTALANGTNELSSGSNKLVNGQQELNSGVTKLTSAVPELTDGVNKLYDGSKELSDKLGEGADKLKDSLVNSSKDMGEFASQAINMNSEAINKIPNYGTGFAPYFMPLSLWIGAIMMFFVIPSKLKDEENLSNFDVVAGKFLSYAFVGVLQAILVSTVVLMLGLKPTNIGVYFLTNIFLSLVFVAIVQCFISLFGDAGRLLSIILLILQLTACAGTFPLEVLPKFFKTLYPFMPFTYAVQALREVISADVINYSIVRKDLLVLGLILIIFLAISISLKKVGTKITSAIEGRKSDVTA